MPLSRTNRGTGAGHASRKGEGGRMRKGEGNRTREPSPLPCPLRAGRAIAETDGKIEMVLYRFFESVRTS